MCGSLLPKPKAPKQPAPAPEQPPSLEDRQVAPELASRTTDRTQTNKKRLGRQGLRIDLQVGGGGGSGVNIPRL